MKQTVNFTVFVDTFQAYDRYNQMGGYDGLKALFEYLEQLENDCGMEIELDVVAICCDYSQYDTALEAAKELITDYDSELDGETVANQEETDASALEALQEHTTVIEYPGGIIVQSF